MTLKSTLRLAALTLAVVAFTGSVARADTPVAVIDLAKILETSAAGKDLQAKFKAKKEAVQKEAIAFEKDLRDKDQTLKNERKNLDDKAFAEKKKGFEAELKKKREAVLSKNVSLEKSKNEALRTLQVKVAQLAANIAEEKKIQVVLDRTAVVIAQQSLDITGDVTKKLDETMKTVDLK